MKENRFSRFSLIILALLVVASLLCQQLAMCSGADGCVSSFLRGVSGQSEVRAEQVLCKGQIANGCTRVNIRKEPNSSSEILTCENAGFRFDIYGVVKTSETNIWYKVGFNSGGAYTIGYVYGVYVQELNDYKYEEQGDFEEYLSAQGFPESYKTGLRQLHAQYPAWRFVANNLKLDWEDFIAQQNVIGRSLVKGNSDSSWKSSAAGCYDASTDTYVVLDSGGWVQASEALVMYAADPRNYLNSTNIFAFECLSFDDSLHNEEGIANVLSDTFMENSTHDLSYENSQYTYAKALFLAGKQSGVSPYHLASRILQEQGYDGKGNSISGNQSGYSGIYNYYNIGAVASGNLTAVQNGLRFAAASGTYLRPWNSRMRALLGGAIYIGQGYIAAGQDTIYYEKFAARAGNYHHQYMTNITAVFSESATASRAYSEDFKKNNALVFYIPVYDNMPEKVCSVPKGDGNSNNYLSVLSVEGCELTPAFDKSIEEYSVIVGSDVTEVDITATAVSGSSAVSGVGKHTLKYGINEIEIVVTAENGIKRVYSIDIARGSGGTSDNGYFVTDYTVNNELKQISAIAEGTKLDEVLAGIEGYAGVSISAVASDGTAKTGAAATGDKVVITDKDKKKIAEYEIVICGDVNGDGVMDIFDIVGIKNCMLKSDALKGAALAAADVNGDGTVDLMDIVATKNKLLEREG